MATWDDLAMFTYDEIEEMELTYNDLFEMSNDELIKLANEKLEKFKQMPDEIVFSEQISERLTLILQCPAITINLTPPENDKWTKKLAEKLFDNMLALGFGLALAVILLKMGIS